MAQKASDLDLIGNTSWEDPTQGKAALSKGGVYRWEDDLQDNGGNSSVGGSVFRGVVDGGPDAPSGDDAAGHSIYCSGWLRIQGRGKIYVEGRLSFPGGEVGAGDLAITGGTKEFAGASGGVAVSRINPKRYIVTF